MGLYKFDNTNVSDDDLSTLQKTLSSRFTNSVRDKVSLDDFDPALIRRLTHRYYYHLLITDDEHPFQDLLILFRADDPAKRMGSLTLFGSTIFFEKIRWSAYKYAQLLDILHNEGCSYKDADSILQKLDSFKSIDEAVRAAALKHIVQPNHEQTNELAMLQFACRKYEQDINNGNDSNIFTDGSDFKNIKSLLHALNFLSIASWKSIFAVPNIKTHLEFAFTDTSEVEEMISVLDDDKRHTFLAITGLLEAILVGLNHTQRWMLVAYNYDFLIAYHDCMKEASGVVLLELMGECPENVDAVVVKNINALAQSVLDRDETKSEGNSSFLDSELDEPQGLAMSSYTFLSSMFPNDFALLTVQEALLRNDLSFEDLEPELIRRLTMKFHYSQLIPEALDTFQGLLNLLRADDPKYRIRALKAPVNQQMLLSIAWSAYKYAQLLDICRSDKISHEQAHNALYNVDCFIGIWESTSSRALHGIIKPNEKEAYGLSMLEFACKQFEQDVERESFSLVFMDASDFANQETFLHALNMISMDYWPKLLGLPNMKRHLEFLFEDSEDAEDLLDILDETRRIAFLMWPGVMISFLGALSATDRTELIESNTVVRVCYQEWLEESEMNSENDDVKTIDDFNSLIDAILDAELPEKLSLLKIDDVQELLKKSHWSAYKYASILVACATDYETCADLDRTFSALPCFENVSESVRKTALEDILKPMSEDHMRFCSEPFFPLYVVGVQRYSAKAYSRAYEEQRADNNVFTHADDFEDIHSFISALAEIPLSSWETIFSLPGMDKHAPFLIQVDKDDTNDALTILENDQDKYNAFMTRRTAFETILNESSIEEDQELREAIQDPPSDQDSKHLEVSDAPIKEAADYIVSFSDLRDLLLITIDIDHIAYLSKPKLQDKLRNMHWNAFKYAALLSICEKRTPCDQADAALAVLPGFQMLTQAERQTALVRITKSIRYQEYKSFHRGFTFSVFTHACQLYAQDVAQKADPDPFFTHADDFFHHTYLFTALNEIPMSHWAMIFALPEMETHVPFLLEGYVQFFDFLPVKQEPNVLESLKIIKDLEKVKAFLERPNVLEAILTGLSHEQRWTLISTNNYSREAFIQRIGQGRGDKVLTLLGHCPDSLNDETICKVHEAAKEGYEQLGTQGLSSAQCKQFHFFSPQPPHPFLANLEKDLGRKNACNV
jgi:hypothetical protein